MNTNTRKRFNSYVLPVIGIALVLLSYFSSASALQTFMRTESKTVEIDLDTRDDQDVRSINLSDYDIARPAECDDPTVFCQEYTHVHVTIDKTWEIVQVGSVRSEELSASEFAAYYPNIQSESVTSNSPTEDILLLQRALYDRGLLPVEPTGRFGVLTELAMLHFQQIKGYEEWGNGEVIAGPRSVADINAMKDRMKDPEYLQDTSVPELDIGQLSEGQSNRLALLNDFIDAAQNGNISQVLTAVDDIEIDLNTSHGSADESGLRLEGYVKIER